MKQTFPIQKTILLIGLSLCCVFNACSTKSSSIPEGQQTALQPNAVQLLERAREERNAGKVIAAEKSLKLAFQQQTAEAAEPIEIQATLFELGSLAEAQHDYLGASKYYGRALEYAENKRGAENEAQRQILLARGAVLLRLDLIDAAAADFERALLVSRRLYGLYDFKNVIPLNNLGALHMTVGNTEQAERMLLAAEKLVRRTPTASDSERASVARNLLQLYQRRGDKVKVLQYQRWVSELR